MGQVQVARSVALDAGADIVWAYISDFSNYAQWQPHIESVEMQDDGLRRVHFKAGLSVLDRVISRDDRAKTYTYSPLPNQGTPGRDLMATFTVIPHGDTCGVEYRISIFVPDEAEQPVTAGINADVDGALGQLVTRYNGS